MQASDVQVMSGVRRRPHLLFVTFAGFSLAFALFTVAPRAAAGGSLKVRNAEAQEVAGSWRLFTTIELSRAPATAHVPMRFVFTKTAVFERALVDKSADPVVTLVPVVRATPTFESLDVDFSDATGKIFKGTRFDFALTRARGYEAGEYQLHLRAPDGQEVGSGVRVVLRGNNAIVDRRSVTFNDTVAAKNHDPAKGAKSDFANYEPPSRDVAPVGAAPSYVPREAFDPIDEERVKTRPRGCGCRAAGLTSVAAVDSSGAALGTAGMLMALSAAIRRLRRRDA